MWLFDDDLEMEEFQIHQQEVRRLEGEYIESRFLLRNAEEELNADPDNSFLLERVREIVEKVRDLESLEPRFATDHPLGSTADITWWVNRQGGFATK